MDPLTLRRLSGAAAVAAGPLCILGGMLHPSRTARRTTSQRSPHRMPSARPRCCSARSASSASCSTSFGNVLNAIPHLVIMAFAGPELAAHDPEMVSENGVILAAPGFETEQVISGIGFIVGPVLFGIALLRGQGVPRWLGWTTVAGAGPMFAPLPLMPVVSGLQIELPRGIVIVGLGLLAIRSTRPAAVPAPEPLGVA